MRSMSSKEIKDRYGAFVEAARREPVVHTSHGRATLVTISIDRAREIPQLREELQLGKPMDAAARIERLRALAGIGVKLVGPQSAEALAERSRQFRGDD